MANSPRLVVALITTVLLLGVAASVSAQRNPTMPSQQADSNKENLYAQFEEYRKSVNPEERRLAYPAAKDYLRKFGGDNDSNARDVQAFVTTYERALHDGDVFSAYTAKNYLKAFELGRPRLKTDPTIFLSLPL